MTASATKDLARDSEFEQAFLNVKPQFEEDINQCNTWEQITRKTLALEVLLKIKHFS